MKRYLFIVVFLVLFLIPSQVFASLISSTTEGDTGTSSVSVSLHESATYFRATIVDVNTSTAVMNQFQSRYHFDTGDTKGGSIIFYKTLIGGLLGLVGYVGAEKYSTHEYRYDDPAPTRANMVGMSITGRTYVEPNGENFDYTLLDTYSGCGSMGSYGREVVNANMNGLTYIFSVGVEYTLSQYTEQPYEGPWYDYCIEFENWSETLIRDDTWLHDIFYEDYLWEEGWRYATTVRVSDEQGLPVDGALYPIPAANYGIETFSLLQWPVRQFETFWDINLEALQAGDLEDMTFYIDSPVLGAFENLYFNAPSLIPGRANKYVVWWFEPLNEEYDSACFSLDLDSMRMSAVESNYWADWDAPYTTYSYGGSYRWCTSEEGYDFDIDEFYDDIETLDIDEFDDYMEDEGNFPEGWKEDMPGVDADDYVTSGSLYGRVQERIEGFTSIISSRAPFGYLALIISELQGFSDDMGTGEASITIETSALPFYDEDVVIDLMNSDFADVMATVRLISGWAFYSFLGIFFFREYKNITGSGGGE